MPDGSINVKITADASGFNTVVNETKGNAEALASTASELSQTLAQLSQSAEESQQQLENLSDRLGRTEESSRNAESGIGRIHESFGKLRESALKIAEVFGIGFGIREAVEGLKSLAEMGEHATNVGESLGLTAVQYERLAGAMRLAGGNSESLTRVLIMLERSAHSALNEVGGPQADAFRELGITTEQLKQGLVDLPSLLYAVADAYNRYASNAEKARALSTISGGARAVQNLAPFYRGGAAGLQEREEESERRSGLGAENLKKLQETAEGINKIKESFLGLGVAIYNAFHEPIETGIKSIEKLLEDGKKVDDLAAKFDHLAGAIAGAWAGFKVGGLPGGAVGGALGLTFGFSEVAGEIEKRLQVDADNLEKIEKGWEWFKAHAAQLGQNFRNLGVDLGVVEASASAALPPKETDLEGQRGRALGHEPMPEEKPKPVLEPGESTESIKKQTAEKTKALDEEVKLSEARYALQEAQANGDRQKIAQIEEQKVADAKAVLEKKRRIYEDEIALLRKRGMSEADIEQIAPKSERTAIDVESINLDTQQQRAKNAAANEAARDAIRELEVARKGADEQEQLQLHLLARRTSLGEVTVSAAAAAEQQIVQAHAARVAQILAQEAQQAQGQKQLLEEVRNRAIESEQREAAKLAEIQEKSYEDRVKRAKEIDKELASSLADAIMGVAEHKETWGQAIVKFFEQQEKKLLEKSLQKLFDQSGIGEMFGGLFDFGGSNSPEDALKIATSANTQATGLNTDALDRLIAALNQQIKAPGTGTAPETKTGRETQGGTTAAMLGPYATESDVAAVSGKATVTAEYVASVAEKFDNLTPAFANAVADIESSHGANLGDTSKSQYAGNIYQLGDKERQSLGVHGQGTPEEQTEYGLRLLSQRRKELSEKLGREATLEETYLAHLFGVTGASKLITANPNTPAEQVINPEHIASNRKAFGVAEHPTVGQLVEGVEQRVARGEQRYSGVSAVASNEHKQAATEHKEAAADLKGAAHDLKEAAKQEKAPAGEVPTDNSPYAKAVAADIAKNGPMAGPAEAATTSESQPPPALQEGGTVTSTGLALVHAGETVLPPDLAHVAATAPLPPAAPTPPAAGPSASAPIPIDIRAVAGSPLARPATTSGGGLPVSTAAPPSAAGGEPAAATAERPTARGRGTPPSLTQATAAIPPPEHAAPVLGGDPFNPAGVAGSPGTPSGPTPETFEQFYGTPPANPPFGGEGMLTREHESAVRADTKAIEQHAQTHAQPGTTQPGPQLASAGATDAADASKEGNGLLGQLLGLLPLVAALIGLTSKNKTERAVGLGIGGVGLLSLLGKGGIPGFAEGGPVDETGLALVHEGEYVVPANLVSGLPALGDSSTQTGYFERIGQDFRDFFAHPIEHVKGQLAGIGQAFVGTAQGYSGQIQRIQEAANTGVPMAADDMAGFITQHIMGAAPAGSLSAGVRLADLRGMSPRTWIQAANEELLPKNIQFFADEPPIIHPELREGVVGELTELNEKYPLNAPTLVSEHPFGLPEGVFGGATPDRTGHNIWIPSALWASQNRLEKRLFENFQYGYTPSSDVRSIVTHEYGHLLDYELGGVPEERLRQLLWSNPAGDFDPLLQALKDRGVTEAALSGGPSDYAATHPDEWFPEAFSAIRHPGRLPPTQSEKSLNDYIEFYYGRGPYPEAMSNLWRLTPDPDKVMQLHMPLSAQPAGVRRALEDWGITPENPDWGPDVLGQEIWDSLVSTQEGPGDTARNFVQSGIEALQHRDAALIRLSLPATDPRAFHGNPADFPDLLNWQSPGGTRFMRGAPANEPPVGLSSLLVPDEEIASIAAEYSIPTRGITKDEFFEQYARAVAAETIGGQIPLHANPETERAFIEAQKRLGLDHDSQISEARKYRERTIEGSATEIPGLATGGTVTQSGLAQIHTGETIVPAQVVPIQTIQAGAQQSQPGPGPVGQTTQTPWLSIIGTLAALVALPKLLGGFGGKGTNADAAAIANTQATQQNTVATQQDTEAKKDSGTSAPVTSGEVGGTGTPGTGVDVGLLRTAVSGQSAGGEEIKQFAKGGPVDRTGLAMLHAGEYVLPSSDDGDITGDSDFSGGSGWFGGDDVEMVTNPLTGYAVPRYGADGADWAMANLAEWKEGPSGSLAQRAWSSVKGAGSWAWSFNPFNAEQFSAQSSSSNSVLGGMSWEQVQSLTPMTAFNALDVLGGGGPGGSAKGLMASLGGGGPDATGASSGMMAWLNSLWSGSAEAAPAYAEGGVVSAAGGTVVVPGEIAPVATQGSASPVLPSTRGLGKGWELWAAILALLLLLGGKKGGAGTDLGKLGETKENPLPDDEAAELGGLLAAGDFTEADAAALGGQLVAGDFSAPDIMATGGASASAGALLAMCEGAVMPSAKGGLQVQETSLPHGIKAGVRGLAATGRAGLFRAGRLTSSLGGAPVADGKGGQLAVVHPGEMILPAPETSQVLSAMSSEAGAIVPSAAGGTVVALPEQQTVSSLGFQPITLQQANPSSNLGGLTQILALIMALQKLVGGLDGLFGSSGGNTSPTGTKGQSGGLFGGDGLLGGILGLPQKLLGGIGNLFGFGSTSGGGANSGIQGMTQAASQAAPALQGLTSSSSNASSGLLGLASKLLGFGGGGAGGGGGGVGGFIGPLFGILGSIIGLEKGGVIPSAAGGMVVGPGGAVPDGKGGRLIVAHPQEMVLPAREARGLSKLLTSFEPSAPSEGGLGRILGMRMMTPQLPHFAQGAWELDRDMLGLLHQGEAVVPTAFAAGLRAMGGGAPTTSSPSISYGDTHVHLSAIDSRSGAQFLMAHSDTIAKSFFRAHRNNSRFTPG